MIPWTELQSFHVLAQTGQQTRAAARLGVDSTTIGRRVRRLETRLGAVLFEQARAGLSLSEAGERLLLQVDQMQSAAVGIQESAAASDGLQGTVRLSVSEGFGTWIVAEQLGEFRALHPDVIIELAATTGFLSPSRRETDIAIMLAKPQTGPVFSRKLSDYRLRLYASNAYLQARPPINRSDQLSNHTLIGYIPDLIYAPQLRYLSEIDETLAPTLRSSSINAQYRMIASGLGVGILPRFIGDADKALVPVLPQEQILRSFWIVTHKDTREIARVKAFHHWLVTIVERNRPNLMGAD